MVMLPQQGDNDNVRLIGITERRLARRPSVWIRQLEETYCGNSPANLNFGSGLIAVTAIGDLPALKLALNAPHKRVAPTF
jgi:hypothetical protein